MRIKLKALQIILVIGIATLTGYFFGVNQVKVSWKNYQPSAYITNKEAPSNIQSVDFSLFWNVWERLERSYYDKSKLDPQKMLSGAITGMTQSLEDPYTMFLPPKQNTNFKDGLAGQFSGIGAELGTKDKQIIVIAPLNGSPAEKAGIKAGDTILKVDGEATFDWTLPFTVEKIRGPKGTTVTLSVLHKGASRASDIRITRDIITVKSVTGWVKNVKCQMSNVKCQIAEENEKCDNCSKVAYIRLSQFGDSTNKDWQSIVNEFSLKIQKDKNIKGLIIDLRNNPGGYLTDAVYISSEFLRQGAPVVLEENPQKGRITLSVTRKGLMEEVPLVVLINKGSASASEIVSGALRDNKVNGKSRAILVGETSFGKGTIQQADDLGRGAGLHVTVAKWLTPNGTWVNGTGLKPDIEAAMDEKDPSHDLQLEKAILELLE
ncbi:MAG: S41 family peptidase [Candidatus Levybacteria bacterium]|nr:S41 family peptidase [Candidatus Levybacteria bacterium]